MTKSNQQFGPYTVTDAVTTDGLGSSLGAGCLVQNLSDCLTFFSEEAALAEKSLVKNYVVAMANKP